MVLYNISEELKELFNKFRTHVRKNYKMSKPFNIHDWQAKQTTTTFN